MESITGKPAATFVDARGEGSHDPEVGETLPAYAIDGKADTAVSSPAAESTLYDFANSPESVDSVAKAKQDAAFQAVSGESTECSASEKSSPMNDGTWTEKAFNHSKVQRVRSSIADSFLGLRSNADGAPRPWVKTWLRFGPLSGIFCMIIAIASVMASLGILAGSNGVATAHWVAPPSTYLAICTAIANLAMRYACIQGVVIAWWYRASRGSTLTTLHYDWRSGTTLRGALTAGRRTGLLSLACIFSTVAIIDGPLLQRASTVRSASVQGSAVNLRVGIAPEIPTDYTGGWDTIGSGSNAVRFTYIFNDTVPTADGTASNHLLLSVNNTLNQFVGPMWYADAPITGVIDGCAGSCRANIRAPALAVTSCTTRTVDVDYHREIDEGALMIERFAPAKEQWNFLTATNLLHDDGGEKLNLITGFAQPKDCAGIMTYQACTLESAIGSYEVDIKDNQATLLNPAHPDIIAIANNTGINNVYSEDHDYYPSTLGGIGALVATRWDGQIMTYSQRGSTSTISLGTGFEYFIQRFDPDDCMAFDNPHEDMLATLNKLMVYTGVAAAVSTNASYYGLFESRMDPGLQINTTAMGYRQGEHNVYHTNYWYFLAATMVEVVCIALVLPTYWGWWTLGRSVSFSPLELAKVRILALSSTLTCDNSSSKVGFRISDAR